ASVSSGEPVENSPTSVDTEASTPASDAALDRSNGGNDRVEPPSTLVASSVESGSTGGRDDPSVSLLDDADWVGAESVGVVLSVDESAVSTVSPLDAAGSVVAYEVPPDTGARVEGSDV